MVWGIRMLGVGVSLGNGKWGLGNGDWALIYIFLGVVGSG